MANRKTWSALFEPDAELYDDGSPRSLKEFTRDALGHERFTSIDRVENNGLDLTGSFHSDRWGDSDRFPSSPHIIQIDFASQSNNRLVGGGDAP